MLPAALGAADPAILLAGSDVVPPGQVLADFARAHDLGYVEILAANPGRDPFRPGAAPLLLPTAHLPPGPVPPATLVVNLGDMRLYWRDRSGRLDSVPVGIGRDGLDMRPGRNTVTGKRRDPTWVPPPSVRAEKPWLPERVPPGPDNPLGAFSLDLQGLVRIHGTNLPDGVGRRVSHGCFRLYPEDIARLFPQVPIGTPVLIVDQRAKLARLDGHIWLEIAPGTGLADMVEERDTLPPAPLPGLEQQVAAFAGRDAPRVDWRLVQWAEETHLGVPVRITRPVAEAPLALTP